MKIPLRRCRSLENCHGQRRWLTKLVLATLFLRWPTNAHDYILFLQRWRRTFPSGRQHCEIPVHAWENSIRARPGLRGTRVTLQIRTRFRHQAVAHCPGDCGYSCWLSQTAATAAIPRSLYDASEGCRGCWVYSYHAGRDCAVRGVLETSFTGKLV